VLMRLRTITARNTYRNKWPDLIRELLPRSGTTAYRSVRAYDAFFCWLGAGNRTADGPIPYCSQIRVAAVMISSNHSCSCSGETSSFVCIRDSE
jgi:hypothetical protein